MVALHLLKDFLLIIRLKRIVELVEGLGWYENHLPVVAVGQGKPHQGQLVCLAVVKGLE
jgi:hypothetical protein